MSEIYEPVIGLEIHAQISSITKMFCGCSNDSFGKPANTNVCPICMGFPGMLPVLNEVTVKKGIRAGLALNCTIPLFSKFDRKNYFYPDLPKGFQISQYDEPVAIKGSVEIERADGTQTVIGVTRLHLEDDAGKLTHTADGTLCDYNRSGCPLMEIVSEPDMRTVEEASAYAQQIRRILRYVGSSDCDMEKGMMRFDINVSLRKKGVEKFGTKVEVKNLNSFRALEKALVYEIERQTEMLNEGKTISQETRGWDDATGTTVSQRSKEEAHDYRYFPEPDLPPLVLQQAFIDEERAALPELPLARKKRFITEYQLAVDDAILLVEEPDLANYFEEVVKVSGDAKKSFSFVATTLLKHLKEDHRSLEQCTVTAQQLGMLVSLVNKGALSNNQAKSEVFEVMYKTGKNPDVVMKELGIEVVSDVGAIEALCKAALEKNPAAVADFKAGKEAAIGFIVGQVMKESKGKAQPAVVQEILRKLLV
ncbi:Asp-tRNA(Asn)/Glu-tRNA(Gln) amidotransferase subunit GatB [Candidatus Gracilibacteria bacterium]|nr:Asp-tRNA(Asn)/Glu-tRNA(Gln) amidotransferase subunit GatB [Candidatus Gracilibacteria bacterium]